MTPQRREPFLDETTDPDFVGVVYTAEGLAVAEIERLREHYASLAELCRGIPRSDYATKVDATAGELAATRMAVGMDWLIAYFREREDAAEARLKELLDC